MTEAAALYVTVAGKDVGAEALINRVRAAGRQADADLTKSGANIGTSFSAGVNKASGSALALQQAQARLEASQGNLVGAADRLRNALAQQGTTTTQTIGAQRQLAAVEAQSAAAADRAGRAVLQEAVSLARLQQASGNTAGAIRTLTGAQAQLQAGSASFNNLGASIARLSSPTESLASQFTGSLKGSLLGIVGPAAAAGAALGVLSSVAGSFIEAFKFKAELDGTTASINSQLGSVRNMTTVWAEASATARTYRLTQADTNAILASSVDVLRSSQASVGELEIALLRLGSRDPSKPISEAARALRELNAGDVTTIKEIFNVGTQDAGRMKREIEGGADAVQVLTAYLDQAGSGMDILAQRTTGALGAMNELKVAQEDLALAQAAFAEGPGLTILQAKIDATRGATRLLSGDVQTMGESLAASANQGGIAFASFGSTIPGLGVALQHLAAITATLQARQAEQAAAMAQAAEIPLRAADAYDQFTASLLANQQIAAQASAAQLAYADSMAMGGVQARAAALAAEQKGTADQVAAIDAQTHAVAQAELTAQAQRAAQALLAGGQAGANTAAMLAGSSSQVDVLTAAFYRLAAAQAAAAVKPQLTAVQRATDREFDTPAERAKVKSDQALAANRALLSKINADERKAAAGGRAAGKAAGAAKLSDQTKLNNQLLAGQEQYQDKAEQAALDHESKLLDIEQQFQERSLQQQRTNETGKRDSRGSFYRTLLLDTEGISPQVQGSLTAAYEAAFAKSQELAQQGNAKLAADYLALKQEQLEAEAQFQSDLAKARADGDKDLIARLEAVHALEAQAAAEREKQLLAGGDADVAARDKALSEEEQRYAEQTGKIGNAADQAAERKILAAERAGKAIDAENLKLQQQEALLNRIGGAGGTVPGTPQPAGAPTSAPTTPAAPATGLEGILGTLEGIIGAINAAKDALTREQGNTTSAVKGLTGRLVG